jgi:hypothetical protein
MKLRRALAWVAPLLPAAARASFLSGDTLDTVANWLAWFVIIVVPFVAIGAFLFVHVLPEKIAEKRHHPQKHAIKVLCILSLIFGGMLWPLAWLWAYTRPTLNRAIYGTEMHEDYYIEQGELAIAGKLSAEDLLHLRTDLAAMAAKGPLSPPLRLLTESLDHLVPAPASPPALPVRATPRSPEAAVGGTR